MRFAFAAAIVSLGLCRPLVAQSNASQPLTSSSSITLQLNDAEPRVAYEQLAAEMHLSLDRFSAQAWRGSEDARISATFDHTPFWEAFTKLAEQTSSVPSWWDSGTIALTRDEGAWAHQPAVIVGPLRISATSGTSRHSLLIAHMPAQENSTILSLLIANEPNSPVLNLKDLTFPAALDSEGKPITAELLPPLKYINFTRGRANADVKLGLPSDNLKGIKQLKISFNAAVAELQKFEIPDIQTADKVARETPVANLLISFHQQGNGGFSVEIEATPKSDDAAAWSAFAANLGSSNIRLLDAKGNAIPSNGGSNSNLTRRAVRTLTYRPGPANVVVPQTLACEVPISVQFVPVTVEFKDLPLP